MSNVKVYCGPKAVYPAVRTYDFRHGAIGFESYEIFTIREVRADGLILNLNRMYPCHQVNAVGAGLVWRLVEQEYMEFWEDMHHG